MPQSLSMNLVYSTKNRDASFTPAIRSKLHAYQVGILQKWNSQAIVIGGGADHVHALLIVCCAPFRALRYCALQIQGDALGTGTH